MRTRTAGPVPPKQSLLFWCLYVATCAACCGFLVALLVGCKASVMRPANPPAPNADHTITLSWKQNFADSPACPTSTPVSCISGFVEGYLGQGSAEVQLHADTPTVCSGSQQPESCTSTFQAVIPVGNVTFYVRSTGYDSSGNAAESAAATSPPVAVALDSATDVQVTVGD